MRIDDESLEIKRKLGRLSFSPTIVESEAPDRCRVLLSAHIRTCVAEDLRAGRAGTADELMEILQKLMK